MIIGYKDICVVYECGDVKGKKMKMSLEQTQAALAQVTPDQALQGKSFLQDPGLEKMDMAAQLNTVVPTMVLS